MGFRTADTLTVLFHHFFFNLLNLYLLDIYDCTVQGNQGKYSHNQNTFFTGIFLNKLCQFR